MKNDNFNQVILSGYLVADAQVKKPDFIIASLATNYDFWFDEKTSSIKIELSITNSFLAMIKTLLSRLLILNEVRKLR